MLSTTAFSNQSIALLPPIHLQSVIRFSFLASSSESLFTTSLPCVSTSLPGPFGSGIYGRSPSLPLLAVACLLSSLFYLVSPHLLSIISPSSMALSVRLPAVSFCLFVCSVKFVSVEVPLYLLHNVIVIQQIICFYFRCLLVIIFQLTLILRHLSVFPSSFPDISSRPQHPSYSQLLRN